MFACAFTNYIKRDLYRYDIALEKCCFTVSSASCVMVTTFLFNFMPLIFGFDFNAWLNVSTTTVHCRVDNGHPCRIPYFSKRYPDVKPLLITQLNISVYMILILFLKVEPNLNVVMYFA